MNKSHKKILIITPLFHPLFGGMEEQCYLLGQEFLRLGYGVDILTERTKREFPAYENMDGLNVYRMAYIKKRNAIGYLKLASNLIFFVLKRQKDYEFCMMRTLTFPAIIVGLLKYLRLTKFKTIVTAETGGDGGDFAVLERQKFKKPAVFFLNQHNYLNSISEDHLNHFKELKFDKRKLTKLYNGINISMYARSSYPVKVTRFLFIGRLVREKGLRELLEAFKRVSAKHPSAKLYIGGDGPEKGYILNFISKNNLSNSIEHKGFITRDQKSSFFALGDCLILPSYSEGFPVSIIEATIYKKLIIATDVSDLKSLYGNKIIFCEKKDSNDLYDKISYAMNDYDESRMNYDEIIKKVDIKNLSASLINLFKQ